MEPAQDSEANEIEEILNPTPELNPIKLCKLNHEPKLKAWALRHKPSAIRVQQVAVCSYLIHDSTPNLNPE